MAPASNTKPWEERFSDLLDFKAQHGHCNVPRVKAPDGPYKSLGRWVNKMRGHYKQHLHGEASGPLTVERIQMMEEAGFQWDGRNVNKRGKTGGASSCAAASASASAAAEAPSRNSLRIRLSPSKMAAAAATADEENGYDDYDDDDQMCSGCEGARDFEAEAADEPVLLCDGCDREFHLGCTDLTAIPQGDFFCGLCDGGPVTTERDEAQEQQSSSGAAGELSSQIICPHCSKTFMKQCGLSSHILTCKKKPAPTAKPKKDTCTSGGKVQEETSFACEHCGKTFKRNSGLATHLNTCPALIGPLPRKDHSKSSDDANLDRKPAASSVVLTRPPAAAGVGSSKFGVPLVCHFCSKQFARLNGLTMHVKTCPNRLAKTGKTLPSSSNTDGTAEQGEQEHICLYCAKTFLKKAGLAMHEKTCAVRLLSKQEVGSSGILGPVKKRKRKSKAQASTLPEDLDEPESLEDICFACRGARDDEAEAKDVPVLLCDGLRCEREYHLFCTDPRITEVPDGHFFCPRCTPLGTSAHLEAYLDESEERSADFRSSKQYVLHLLRKQMKESLSAEDDAEANKAMDEMVTTEGRAPKRARKSESSVSIGKEDDELSQWGRERPPRSEISRALELHAAAIAERGRHLDKGQPNVIASDANISASAPPSFFIGKPIQLYCPLDNAYHQGRIVDWRKSTRGYPQYYGTGDVASSEFLVRFPPGINGRKIGLRRWIILEEHCVAVSLAIVFAEQKKVKGLAGWKPAQIMARSSLELIPVRRLLIDDGELRGLAFFFGDGTHSYLKLRDEATSFSSRSFATRRGERVENAVSVLEGLGGAGTTMISSASSVDGTNCTKPLDIAVHQAFLEHEEQQRVKEWGQMSLKDPTHIRALTVVDEYELGPLMMPVYDNASEEESAAPDAPNASSMQVTCEDEKKEEDTAVDPEPLVQMEREYFPAHPQIERGVDRRWLSHLITGEKSQTENSMDAFAGMKLNSAVCIPSAMARLQEQRKRRKIESVASVPAASATVS